jgi:hypothetical protein
LARRSTVVVGTAYTVSRTDPPLQIDVPAPSADQPPWSKVGVVAAIGFVIGVAWPRLAGVTIGPAPPQDNRPSAAAMASAKAAPMTSAAGMPVAVPAPASSGQTGTAANEQTVVVSPGEISRCRDAKGKAAEKCDDLALDPLLSPRLKELSRCPAAIGLSGKLTIGFELDFKKRKISVQHAKGKANLPKATLDGVTRCTEKSVSGVSLDDLTHEQNKYLVGYTLAFFPPGKVPDTDDPSKDEKKPEAKEEAKATEIVWRSVQVHDAPKKSAPTIAKLTKGTKVTVLEQKDDLCRIDFGDGKQGWIVREAVGK